MAVRTKTIEYAFPLSTASVATATARDFAQIAALVIPETTSRTFKSVILQCSAVDGGTTATSVSAVLQGIALGAVARSDSTVTFTVTNSGEHQAWIWDRNVTSYFASNYTGTTMTADCRLTVTGPTTINCTAKLIITYEYDDAATTQIKTVRIPIDGNIGNLTTAFTTIGTTTNQIPLLDTFLPESGVSIRSYFFQMDIQEGTTAAAASTLDMRYDGATTISDTSSAHTLNSAFFKRRIDVLTGLSTSATHSIEAKVTSTTGEPSPCISGVIIVTYTFNLSGATTTNGSTGTGTSITVTDGSVFPVTPFTIQIEDEKMRVTNIAANTLTVTRAYDGTSVVSHATGLPVLPTILNSVMVTCIDEAGFMGGTVTGDKGRFTRDISIQEPGFIALKQSAVYMTLNDAGVISIDLRCGSQASRVYVHPATLRCGGASLQRRIDSGAVGGAGMTLGRGFNSLVIDYFTTSATSGNIGSNASGIMYLNYTSGQDSAGPGAHNHTTIWCLLPWATGGAVQRLQSTPVTLPAINSANYWLVGVSYGLIIQTMTALTVASNGLAFNCEVQGGEAEGAGWRAIYTAIFISDIEIGWTWSFGRGRTEFKRYPRDTDTTRLDIETARDYRYDSASSGTVCWQAEMFLTYHTISYTISGNITGSSGGTVTINAYRTDTGDKIDSTTRVGNGSYSLTWYDNTVPVFVEAWESSTLIGRSDNGVAA